MYILYQKIFIKSSAAGSPQSARKQAFARLIVREAAKTPHQIKLQTYFICASIKSRHMLPHSFTS